MMAPRPSRSTWCTGMDVVPSTTATSSEILSSFGIDRRPPRVPVMDRGQHRYGYRVIKTRNDLALGLPSPADATVVEWQIARELMGYEEAVAAMQARAAAVASGQAPELVWL